MFSQAFLGIAAVMEPIFWIHEHLCEKNSIRTAFLGKIFFETRFERTFPKRCSGMVPSYISPVKQFPAQRKLPQIPEREYVIPTDGHS